MRSASLCAASDQTFRKATSFTSQESRGLVSLIARVVTQTDLVSTAHQYRSCQDAPVIQGTKTLKQSLGHGVMNSSPPQSDTVVVSEKMRMLVERFQNAAQVSGVSTRTKARNALLREIARLEAGIAKKQEPDYCYDPECWEFTSTWKDRDTVHGEGEGIPPGEAMRVCTLLAGPDKWVAEIPGAGGAAEARWFDSEEEAKAAISSSPPG